MINFFDCIPLDSLQKHASPVMSQMVAGSRFAYIASIGCFGTVMLFLVYTQRKDRRDLPLQVVLLLFLH